MRKSYLILLPALCAVHLLAARTADAYVYRYEPGVPAVTTHMSVLDPATQQQKAPEVPELSAPAQPAATLPPQEPQALSHPFFTDIVMMPSAARHAVRKHEKPAKRATSAKAKQAKPKALATRQALQQPAPAVPSMPEDVPVIAKATTAPEQATQAQTTPAQAMPSPAAPAAEKAMPAVPTPAGLTLDFAPTSSTLAAQAKDKLDNIADQMKDVDNLRLQIRGYAKGDGSLDSARRMSLSRVLEVRSYLMNKGIKPIRLDVQALGSATSRLPIDRVDLVFVR